MMKRAKGRIVLLLFVFVSLLAGAITFTHLTPSHAFIAKDQLVTCYKPSLGIHYIAPFDPQYPDVQRCGDGTPGSDTQVETLGYVTQEHNAFISTVPFYELYYKLSDNKFIRRITTDETVRQNLLKQGWGDSRTWGYVFPPQTTSTYAQAAGLVPLYVLYNPANQDRYYTTSLDKKNQAMQSGWTQDEGIICYLWPSPTVQAEPLYQISLNSSPTANHMLWRLDGYYPNRVVSSLGYIFPTQIPDTTPFYILTKGNGGTYFYTASTKERDDALNTGWSYSINYGKILGYVLPPETPQGKVQSLGAKPLYRLLNPTTGDRFYTTSTQERDQAKHNGWTQDEGIACYVWKNMSLSVG